MSKHTPGPWAVEYLHGRSSHWDYIVKMPKDYVGIDTRNAEADARLIAAAPDLLLALSWLAGLQEQHPADYDEQMPLAMSAARAAVAKATGEAA